MTIDWYVGTPSYMAPEIKQNDPKNKKEKIQYNPFLTDGKKKKKDQSTLFFFKITINFLSFFHQFGALD